MVLRGLADLSVAQRHTPCSGHGAIRRGGPVGPLATWRFLQTQPSSAVTCPRRVDASLSKRRVHTVFGMRSCAPCGKPTSEPGDGQLPALPHGSVVRAREGCDPKRPIAVGGSRAASRRDLGVGFRCTDSTSDSDPNPGHQSTDRSPRAEPSVKPGIQAVDTTRSHTVVDRPAPSRNDRCTVIHVPVHERLRWGRLWRPHLTSTDADGISSPGSSRTSLPASYSRNR
jgi:hypothetical protein